MTGFADELFQKLCAGCIADFNGGFPDFCVEELKKRWVGEGHCLRCNAILDTSQFWKHGGGNETKH